MENKLRTQENKKDNKLEKILKILNNTLEDDERDLTRHLQRPKYPSVFIIGNARSGSTLVYQLLASTDLFSYPSNIISRFYNAPYIGALIHKVFVDYDNFGEILGKDSISFNSLLGKTKSAISPHEFWYFWRRFFKFGEIQKLSEEKLGNIDESLFLRELAGLEAAFEKPLLLKAMIINWNLDYLIKLIPNSIFIHIKRDPVYNMQSLYNARLKFFGDVNKWYSFKPPEYEKLINGDVYQQLAGQVYYTNKEISNALGNTGSLVDIYYKDLVSNPKAFYLKVIEKMMSFGYNVKDEYIGPKKFMNLNKLTNRDFNQKKAEKAYSIYL